MQTSRPEHQSSHQLQMSAMREALDRAARSANNADILAARARHDLQAEKTRYKHIYTEWQQLTLDLEQALEENKRLRRSIGELNQERETLAERIRQLTVGTAPKAAAETLRVVAPLPAEPEIAADAVVEFDTPGVDKPSATVGRGFRLVSGRSGQAPA